MGIANVKKGGRSRPPIAESGAPRLLVEDTRRVIGANIAKLPELPELEEIEPATFLFQSAGPDGDKGC